MKYASKAKNATDLRSPFVNVFAAGFFERKEEFDAALRAEAPLPLGALGEQVLWGPAAWSGLKKHGCCNSLSGCSGV